MLCLSWHSFLIDLEISCWALKFLWILCVWSIELNLWFTLWGTNSQLAHVASYPMAVPVNMWGMHRRSLKSWGWIFFMEFLLTIDHYWWKKNPTLTVSGYKELWKGWLQSHCIAHKDFDFIVGQSWVINIYKLKLRVANEQTFQFSSCLCCCRTNLLHDAF